MPQLPIKVKNLKSKYDEGKNFASLKYLKQ